MISMAVVQCRHLLSQNCFTESMGCVGRNKHDENSTFLAKDLIINNTCRAKTQNSGLTVSVKKEKLPLISRQQISTI
jgi:hypothetical protein